MPPEVSSLATSPGDVHDLRALCAVVDLGSLTEAGRLLGETKGAVSRRMARLERQLGVELFRRHPRAIEPTPAAHVLRGRLAPALHLLDEALGGVTTPGEPWAEPLRLTAPPDLGAAVIGPLLADFLAQTPEARVDLLLTERVLSFEAHRVDLAFRVAERLRDSSLVAHRLTMLEASLYASPGYLQGHALLREPRQLLSHPLLVLPLCRAQLELVDRQCPSRTQRLAVQPRVVADATILTPLALAGAGIAVLPTWFTRPLVAEGRLVPVLARHRLRTTTALTLVHRRHGRTTAGPVSTLRAFATSWFAS